MSAYIKKENNGAGEGKSNYSGLFLITAITVTERQLLYKNKETIMMFIVPC